MRGTKRRSILAPSFLGLRPSTGDGRGDKLDARLDSLAFLVIRAKHRSILAPLYQTRGLTANTRTLTRILYIAIEK